MTHESKTVTVDNTTTKPNKTEAVIALLSRKSGATLDELTSATGWQPHTARAAMTALKKRGHTIERTRSAGTSRWRIIEGSTK